VSRSQAEALGDVEREITTLLRRARRQATRNAARVHPDLQPTGLAILQQVVAAADDGVRAVTVCEQFGLDKGSVSRQVQSLEELGLVVRRPDPADGRAHLIVVTPEATRRLERLQADRRARFQGRLADWSGEDLSALADVLAHYNRALAD